ncbi:MAG: hypothetical protein HYZ29_15855 [Myxococcales bacterium]|nr:hypothetical protein [Myxococcales bacterium]
MAALENSLAVPPGTPMAVWNWIRETTPKHWNGAQFRLGEITDADVFASALHALRDPASGSELQRIALDLLSGRAHAASIGDDALRDLVDRPHVDPSGLAELIGSVHKGRTVPTELLLAVRDRWYASPLPGTREAGVDVAALVSVPEPDFWSTAARDSSEDVRFGVIQHLVRSTQTEFALEVVRVRLESERVIDVLDGLHRAMATLLQRAPR